MVDTNKILTKETGELKVEPKFRRYDILDMLTIIFYNFILDIFRNCYDFINIA